MDLEMECSKCKVSQFCDRKGSSPLVLNSSRHKCRILGGFPTQEVPRHKLSEESLKKCDENKGYCLTLAEIPSLEDGIVVYDLKKIFSPPILGDRQKSSMVMDQIYSRSHK